MTIVATKYSAITDDFKQELDSIRALVDTFDRPISGNFGVAGLSDVCRLACGRNPLVEHLGEDEEGKTHGYLVNRIEGFFNRRNRIAHALNSGASSSPEDIGQDIDIFRALGQSLCEILESKQD